MIVKNIEAIVDLLGAIKDVKRTGWVDSQVKAPESVADHSLGLMLLVFLLTPPELDKNKCLKFALIHDLAENKVGDITPFEKTSQVEKHGLELAEMSRLSQQLDNVEMLELFEEYEANESLETKFVHDLDRLEAVVQAKYYDEQQRSVYPIFEEFFAYAFSRLSDKNGLVAQIMKQLRG